MKARSATALLLLAASASADSTRAGRARIREQAAAAARKGLVLQAAAAGELEEIAQFVASGKSDKSTAKTSKASWESTTAPKTTKTSKSTPTTSWTSGSKSSKPSSSTSKDDKSASSSSSSSSSSSMTNRERNRAAKDCIDDVDPKVDGYDFKLFKKSAQCADKDKDPYEYGQFDGVKEFSDCAEACVKDTDVKILDDLRGFDWDCDGEECRCLYDKGTLKGGDKDYFDKVKKGDDYDGEGPVEKGKDEDGWYCAELEDSSRVGVESERALRGPSEPWRATNGPEPRGSLPPLSRGHALAQGTGGRGFRAARILRTPV